MLGLWGEGGMRWKDLVGDRSIDLGALDGGVRGLSSGACLCGVRERGGELRGISNQWGSRTMRKTYNRR